MSERPTIEVEDERTVHIGDVRVDLHQVGDEWWISLDRYEGMGIVRTVAETPVRRTP